MDDKVYRVVVPKRISDPRRQGRNRSMGYQAEECHKYAVANNCIVVEEIEWRGSSWKMTNKDWARIMELAKAKKIDAVLCYKVDRLGRNNGLTIQRCDDLQRFHGVQIWSVMEGKNIPKRERDHLFGQAAQESIDKSERVYPAMRQMTLDGLWPGRIPFGYVKDKTHLDDYGEPINGYITPHDEHAEIVRECFCMADVGASINAITARLDREYGHLRKGGWLGTSVGKMLRNQIYIGRVVWDTECHSRFAPHGPKDPTKHINVPGKHKAIVEPDVFWRVQTKLDLHAHKRTRSERVERRGRIHVLDGVVLCAVCGAPIRPTPHGRCGLYKNGTPRKPTILYRCNRVGHVSMSARKITRYMLNELDRVVFSPEGLAQAQRRLAEQAKVVPFNRRASLVAKAESLSKAIRNVNVLAAQGLYTVDEALETKRDLQDQLEQVRVDLASCPDTSRVAVSFEEAAKRVAEIAAIRPIIEAAMDSTDTAQLDRVSEALHYVIESISIDEIAGPSISWQPWVAALLTPAADKSATLHDVAI